MKSQNILNWNNRPLWQQPVVWMFIVILMTVPFWVTQWPPLLDLPGHMARYHMARELPNSADLQRYYSYDWIFSGNLAGDLFAYGLRSILSVEQASWLFSLLTIVFLTIAIPFISKSFHGSVQISALIALPLVYTNIYLWGFVNYNASVVLALFGLAFWQRLKDRVLFRSFLFLPISIGVWLGHSLGWALMLLFIACIEAERLYQEKRLASLVQVFQTACGILPLLVPLFFLFIWRSNDGVSLFYYHEGTIAEKLFALMHFLRGYSSPIDFIGTFSILMLLIWALRSPHVQFSRPIAACGIALAIGFAVTPSYVLGSAYTDIRFVYVFMILLLISIKTPDHVSGKMLNLASAAFLTYTFVRIVGITLAWKNIAAATQSHLKALEQVPMGARILSFQIKDCTDAKWEVDYQYNHLADFSIVRRNAFVNSQWAVRRALPAQPIYNQDTEFGANPSHYIWEGNCAAKGGKTLKDTLPTFPRDRFDFVWLIRSDLRRTPIPSDLVLVFQDFETELYRITK
jgi:hypothetical protein